MPINIRIHSIPVYQSKIWGFNRSYYYLTLAGVPVVDIHDYLNHGHSLKADFNRMGKGEHYSVLLDWTKYAIQGRLTKIKGNNVDYDSKTISEGTGKNSTSWGMGEDGQPDDWTDDTEGTSNEGYQDSTMKLIMELEGTPFLKPRINDNGTITIGYGYDFTKESDPDMFNEYLKVDSKGNIKVVGEMSIEDAGAIIKKAADKLGITIALDNFINGKGFGNKVKPLLFNQNQYDALFSYFYANGKNVFSDSKYNEWVGIGGEYANRANARKELRDYLINNNGNYNPSRITDLFVNSKGANINYDYKRRREDEASVFNQK